MPTPAQIAANRRNARKSTGPTSAEGKARASRNAVTHGLWAKDGVIAGEDPAEFAAFQQAMLAELRPVGVRQQMVAERIVHLWWKLRRLPGLESAAVRQLIADRPEQDPPPTAVEAMAADLVAPRSVLRTLHSHEMRLSANLRAATQELRDLQAAGDGPADEPFDEPTAPVSRNEPNLVASACPPKVSTPISPPPIAAKVNPALAAAVSAGLGDLIASPLRTP